MRIKYILLILLISGCSNGGWYFPEKQNKKKFDSTVVNAISNIIPDDYVIGPSDGLEILYYIDPGFKLTDYIIDTEDKLKIDLYYYPELSRTVKVRPDGFITLAKIGEIKAVGEKPQILADKISKLYSEQLLKPVVTVELIEFNSKIEALKEAVSTSERGQSKYAVVRPDGKISLPYLRDDIVAAGKTALSLSRELEKQYRKNVNNISITVSILEAKSYQACILGDVQESGCYTLSGFTTFLQLVSRAGGFTKEANLYQVIIISPDKNKHPEHKIVNAKKIINNSAPEIIIHQYDIVYVPRTLLSKLAFTAEAIWQLIPISLSATVYEPKK